MRSADWIHHLLPSGESHQACLRGGISAWTAKSRTDIYDWIAFGFLIVIRAKMKGMNCLFAAKLKNWPELWTQTSTKRGLDEVLPSFVQWARASLRAIPQARLALACAILSHSHCNISPCPSVHEQKETSTAGCVISGTALGTALKGSSWRPALLLLWLIHGRWISSTTRTFLG